MSVVTIPTKEYNELVDVKLRYEYLRHIFEGDIFASPPAKNVKEIMNAFRATRKYNPKFLKSLEQGLRRSSHFHV